MQGHYTFSEFQLRQNKVMESMKVLWSGLLLFICQKTFKTQRVYLCSSIFPHNSLTPSTLSTHLATVGLRQRWLTWPLSRKTGRFLQLSPPQPLAAWLLPPRSTEVMLANVTNGVYIAGVNGPFYVIISLDFSVTFDTLSHLLFLKKNFFLQLLWHVLFFSSPFLPENSFSSLFFCECSSNLGVAQRSQSLLRPLRSVLCTVSMVISCAPIFPIVTWIAFA